MNPPMPCVNRSIALASGHDWPSYSEGPNRIALGQAKLVCVNASSPTQCPASAVVYGIPLKAAAWPADRTSIPNAQWIWRGDTLASSPANQSVIFERTFKLGPNPSGTLSIAADDFAEVLVNGKVAGTTGSLTDRPAAVLSQTTLTKLNLTPYLREGNNDIAIRAVNGPWQCLPNACTYANAPAGVVFGGMLESTCPK